MNMTWPPQPEKPQSSWRPIRSIRSQLAELLGNQRQILTMLHELVQGKDQIMSALDDLKTAVNDAAAEMEHAAQTITMHPNPDVSNDPALMELATRLNTATAALKAVEPPSPEPAPADGSTTPTP